MLKLLSNFSFKFNMRRWTEVAAVKATAEQDVAAAEAGLKQNALVHGPAADASKHRVSTGTLLQDPDPVLRIRPMNRCTLQNIS